MLRKISSSPDFPGYFCFILIIYGFSPLIYQGSTLHVWILKCEIILGFPE
jgi:hypothetical protein